MGFDVLIFLWVFVGLIWNTKAKWNGRSKSSNDILVITKERSVHRTPEKGITEAYPDRIQPIVLHNCTSQLKTSRHQSSHSPHATECERAFLKSQTEKVNLDSVERDRSLAHSLWILESTVSKNDRGTREPTRVGWDEGSWSGLIRRKTAMQGTPWV